jgi:hypothetical protein
MRVIILVILLSATLFGLSCTDRGGDSILIFKYVNLTTSNINVEVYNHVNSAKFLLSSIPIPQNGSFQFKDNAMGEYDPFGESLADSISIIFNNDRYIKYVCPDTEGANCSDVDRTLFYEKNFERKDGIYYYYITDEDYNRAILIE